MSNLLGGRQVERNAPIRDQVASIIRDAIVEMRLKPGQLLIERELCEMTAASRPSVREALRRLEAEGLVESINGRGTIVATATRELAENVYEARAELEGLAASLFAMRATEEQRVELRAAYSAIDLAVSSGESTTSALAAKNVFYEVIFRGSGNPILVQMIGILQRRVSMLRVTSLRQPGRKAESVNEIRDILTAVEARDSVAARTAASRHVNQAARTIFAWLEQNGDIDSLLTP
jgi:DNA-binding GntR family transcriptional regulator